MIEYLDVGKIVNTQGVKGEVKVVPLTDDLHRFDSLKMVMIEIKGKLIEYNITSVKYIKNNVILKFKEVDSMDSAVLLKEKFLKIDRKNAVKLKKDAYFICDLIGCLVFDENDNELGVLSDILHTGSNDVYIVTMSGKKDLLIPALKTVVLNVSIDAKKIIVKLPAGLVDEDEV